MPEQKNPLDEVREALRATVKDVLVFVGNTATKHKFRSNVTGKVGWLSRKTALTRLKTAFDALDALLDEEPKSTPGFHIWSTKHNEFVGYTTDVDVIHDDSVPHCIFYPGTLDEADGLNKDEKRKAEVRARKAYVIQHISILVEKE